MQYKCLSCMLQTCNQRMADRQTLGGEGQGVWASRPGGQCTRQYPFRKCWWGASACVGGWEEEVVVGENTGEKSRRC
jgi:hypothetical protein